MFGIKEKIQSQRREVKPEDLPKIHHDFMTVYGWISIEDFRKIKIDVLLTLYEHVQKELVNRRYFMEGVLRGQGHKNVKWKH